MFPKLVISQKSVTIKISTFETKLYIAHTTLAGYTRYFSGILMTWDQRFPRGQILQTNHRKVFTDEIRPKWKIHVISLSMNDDYLS